MIFQVLDVIPKTEVGDVPVGGVTVLASLTFTSIILFQVLNELPLQRMRTYLALLEVNVYV